jgi:ribosomal protein S18 acetylase RimI-like enzyme
MDSCDGDTGERRATGGMTARQNAVIVAMMSDAIRRASPSDYDAYTAMFRELEVDDPIPSAARFTGELLGKILIYERAGMPVGYVLFDRLAANGYVRNLVVAPGARGGGVGAALMAAAAAELRARGADDQWHLNVKVDNTAAIRLYERLGMRVEHASTALQLAWARLDDLPQDSTPVRVLPVAAEEDDDIERALDILSGRLQMNRARAGVILRQLRDAQLAPVGFACFDPAFPGAFPFRVARPALAGALLRTLAPHARPGDLELQLVIEDDDALTEALLAAGAQVRLRLLHYAGPLPARS